MPLVTRTPTVTSSNGVTLEITAVNSETIIEATSGDTQVSITLDTVAHHRLAAHLARALGFLSPTDPEKIVAWTLGTPRGLWVGSQQESEAWWAVSVEDPEERYVLRNPEQLWPLTVGTHSYFGEAGMCSYGTGRDTMLAHCHHGVIFTEKGYSTTLDQVDGKLYHLELPVLYRGGPREAVARLDLGGSGGRVLVLPMGIVLSDDVETISVVLTETLFVDLLHALADTLPKPTWIRR